MKSPYKVRWEPAGGWCFTLSNGKKKRHFRGFRTDLQANQAKIEAKRRQDAGLEVPTAARLRHMFPEQVDDTTERGLPVRLTMREHKQASA